MSKRMKDIKRADVDKWHRERVSLKAEIERLRVALTEAHEDVTYYQDQAKHWIDLCATTDQKLKIKEGEYTLCKASLLEWQDEAQQRLAEVRRYEWMIDEMRCAL